MTEKLFGYEGKARQLLEKAEAEIGDIIRVTRNGDAYEGILIPRSQYGDDRHVVLKLKSGYNIGVRIEEGTKIEKTAKGVKPAFSPPPPPEKKAGRPKVLILSTGGTIASRVDYRTGAVRPALSANDLYSIVPELAEAASVETEILFSLFSENISPQHWTRIAEKVAEAVQKRRIAGIVIAHGTDTMGYTAAALSFALQNLPIPVVLVGSQRSADRPSSDAALNLLGAAKAAAEAPFAEVVVAMHETVSDESIVFHRGTKVRKCHTSRRDAFKSVNTQPLARLKDGKLDLLLEDYRKRDAENQIKLKPDFEEKVALLKTYPGLSPKAFEWCMNEGYVGIVVEGTGLGHVGSHCLDVIGKAVEKGLLVAMTSQCVWGRVNMNVYDQARDLQALGVVPLEDMLPETALVKMMWAFGQTKVVEAAKKLLLTDVANEFSPRTVYDESVWGQGV